MKYIKATEKDLEQIVNLVQETIKAIYPKYYPKEVVDFFCELHCRENILKDIEAGLVGILKKDDEILGTGCYKENHITRVYVKPVFQKQGYGSYIMQCLENEIRMQHETVYLDASLPASHLYEKLGYKTKKHERWNVENGVILVYEVMEKKLPMLKSMDITTLCEKIDLQPQIKNQVLSFIKEFDFETVDKQQKGYLVYENMKEALAKTQAILGEDEDGIKILSCMLKASADAYEVYWEKNISDEIYFDTMKCFSRFIDETYKMTGKFCFDRYWWTTRQAGCHLFRIGTLEYEIKHLENDVVIGIHIPSDADFSPISVEESLNSAYGFFAKNYSSLGDVEYRCHSWLLDEQLKNMLHKNSNIINFQNRFEIFDRGEEETEFLEWVFNTKSTDYNNLPEKTSLQKKMKKHLLEGGTIRNTYGRLKKLGFEL